MSIEFYVDDERIEESFDRLAKALLTSYVIKAGDSELELTEIEFYYFKKGVHEDNYTHEHDRDAGEWRVHNQGLDITFQADLETKDGGILIRGLKHGDTYINGPIKTLGYIFRQMKSVINPNALYLKQKDLPPVQVFKTIRHLPNKVSFEEFQFKPYRYMRDVEKLQLDRKAREMISGKLTEVA